ncbi:MAG: BspA family leucine-rich repeat surface protein, partial [Bacteroidaceae bacterium]|nr:BspA family leucine-rich repeat surface protein [Bacteroidaceae bacterium]
DLRYPVGATLWNGSVYDADGSKVKGDWVVFGPEGAEALVTPQAYACYTSDNTTLTFYYDKQRNSRTGTTYDLNEVYSNPGWFSDGTRSNVTQVVFDSSFADARPTTTTSWFVEMKNLQSITGLEYLNTSEVTNMRGMFGECISLTSLDLSHFNTAKVTYMDYMFYGCLCLKSIYVGDGWSTTAVTNSEEMFYGCTNLVGSKGTIYDENHIDANYAHIDGGPSNPGYLSQKRGDVNLDGSVDIADAVCVLNAMAGQPVAGDANVNGDYDEDGNPVIDIADLVTILNIMAGQ